MGRARASGAVLVPSAMGTPSLALLLLLFHLILGAAWSLASPEKDGDILRAGALHKREGGALGLHMLAQDHSARAAAISTPHLGLTVPICPDFGPSPSFEQGQRQGHVLAEQPGPGIRFCWGPSLGAPAEPHGSASRARRTPFQHPGETAVSSRRRRLEGAEGPEQAQEQQQQKKEQQQGPGKQSRGPGQTEAAAPRHQQGLAGSEGSEASLVPQVALLEDVFVDHHGDVFNATHRFLFGASKGVQAEPLESPLGEGTKVVELAEVVNLALGLLPGRHQLTEVIHRLPLFVQLCPLMPRLKGARFLLGDHHALRGALGHILGFAPWEHAVQLQESGKALIRAKVLYQPIHAPCPRCPALWAALRNTFLLPPDGLPIFNGNWACRASWPGTLRAAHMSGPPAPLPPDWVVLAAVPPASLHVDPSLLPRGEGTIFLPFLTLGELVRSHFWEERVLSFSGGTSKVAAQALFRRAAILVSAPGAALELLPFMPRGAVVVLVEPRFDGPSATGPKGSTGPSPKDDPLLEQHRREAERLSDTLHAFAEACQLQLLTLACPVAPRAPGSSGVLEGLQCSQDNVAEALAAAEDALCQSGLLGPSPACGVPPGTIPGATLPAEGVAQLAQWAECVGKQGRWLYDPTPRRLPWGDIRVADPGACDAGFMNASAADALAARVPAVHRGEVVDGRKGDEAMKALAGQWNVRLSLKYRWAVDGRACPAPGPGPASRAAETGLVETEDGSYGRHWQPFAPGALCSAMPGSAKKHILFLGDSLTEQMATAMAFNMLRDESKPLDRAAFHKERPQDCLQFLDRQGVGDAISCFTVTARSCPGLQVTFLRNNRLRIVTDSVTKEQIPYYLPFSTVFRHYADEADVVVMNRGAHFTHTPRYARELRSTCRLLRERYPQKLIVFRNTPPGHANCTDHERPLETGQDPGSLPIKFNWKHFVEQNDVAKGIVAQFGILYLDVYSMTKLRADGHKGVTRTFIDCLHYCHPGVLDYWIELLFNTLRHLRLHSS